jgi:hypothetical protein
VLLSPVEGDPPDYAALENGAGERAAATLTCAANAAGRVPEGDWARGDAQSAQMALAALGKLVGETGEQAAQSVMEVAAAKAARTVEALLADRGMSRDTTWLVAGGGGASALVPAVGKRLGLPVRLAANAAVVSAIGTALAMVREVVERTVPQAGEVEVLQIRREAAEGAVRAGADADSVTVEVEYDARTAVLRAVATGQTELRERDLAQAAASDEERLAAAANSMRLEPGEVEVVADSGLLRAYHGRRERKRLLGLLKRRDQRLALVDEQGVVRLVLSGATARVCEAGTSREAIAEALEEHTRYGDAGAELPRLFLGVRGRVVNLSGLVSAAQVLALAQAETASLAQDEQVMVVAAARGR